MPCSEELAGHSLFRSRLAIAAQQSCTLCTASRSEFSYNCFEKKRPAEKGEGGAQDRVMLALISRAASKRRAAAGSVMLKIEGAPPSFGLSEAPGCDSGRNAGPAWFKKFGGTSRYLEGCNTSTKAGLPKEPAPARSYFIFLCSGRDTSNVNPYFVTFRASSQPPVITALQITGNRSASASLMIARKAETCCSGIWPADIPSIVTITALL